MTSMIWAKIKANPLLGMVLCCAVPLVGILALSYFNVLGLWGYYGIMLLCPLIHLIMCRAGHTPSEDSGERHPARIEPPSHE